MTFDSFVAVFFLLVEFLWQSTVEAMKIATSQVADHHSGPHYTRLSPGPTLIKTSTNPLYCTLHGTPPFNVGTTLVVEVLAPSGEVESNHERGRCVYLVMILAQQLSPYTIKANQLQDKNNPAASQLARNNSNRGIQSSS